MHFHPCGCILDPTAYLKSIWVDSGLNHGFRVTVHNDSECRSFFKRFAASAHWRRDALHWYRRIPHGAIRTDYWRVAFLLQNGGVYADADLEPLASLRTFVRPTATFLTSGSLYPAQVNFHLIIARAEEPALNLTFFAMRNAFKTTKYSYWGWSGCKHLHTALMALRQLEPSPAQTLALGPVSNAFELGEGFESAAGNYSLLLERKVTNWPTVRKATCVHMTNTQTHGARNVTTTGASRGGETAKVLRVLFLNKYLFLPGAATPNSSRDTHWNMSIDLWAPPHATNWLVHE